MYIQGVREHNILKHKKGPQKIHHKDLHNLYTSPNITGVIKSKRMMGEKIIGYKMFVKQPVEIGKS
jgi:hypothetical protein